MHSIIITCYNYARFLPDAVASVVAQTCPGWELIIVDDGSVDASPAVAQALAAYYCARRIRVLRQPNRGVAAARNAGARYAQGDNLLFLDADDMLAPTILERSAPVLDQHPAVGFVYGGIRLFGQDDHIWPSQPFDRRALALDNYIPPTALVRRRAWEQIDGFDSSIINGWEDWDFWLRVSADWPGWYLAEPLLFYRRHGSSLSQRQALRDWDARAQIMRKHPDLYGLRLRSWAARRCAHRGLPATPQLKDSYTDALEVLPPVNSSATLIEVQGGQTTPATIHCGFRHLRRAKPASLARRILRCIPFSLRQQVRRMLRKTQFLLRTLSLTN